MVAFVYVSLCLGAFAASLAAAIIPSLAPLALFAVNTALCVLSFVLLLLRNKKYQTKLSLGVCLGSLDAALLCSLMVRGTDAFSSAVLGIPVSGAWAFWVNVAVLVAACVVLPLLLKGGHIQHKPLFGQKNLSDDEKLEQTTRIARWATFVVLSVVVVICACVPDLRSGLGQAVVLLSSGDIEGVKAMILSYGPWAAAVSCALMVLQSMAAPIPAFLITFANAGIFGWWQGAILSWSGAMLGAVVCFMIARLLGRDAVSRFVSHSALKSIDRFFERYGDKAVLICRLLPFISFDYVSYAAGLTPISLGGFLWATGLGQLPATLVYSYVGGMLTGGARMLMMGLLITFALFALAALLRQMYVARHAADADTNAEAEANQELEHGDSGK